MDGHLPKLQTRQKKLRHLQQGSPTRSERSETTRSTQPCPSFYWPHRGQEEQWPSAKTRDPRSNQIRSGRTRIYKTLNGYQSRCIQDEPCQTGSTTFIQTVQASKCSKEDKMLHGHQFRAHRSNHNHTRPNQTRLSMFWHTLVGDKTRNSQPFSLTQIEPYQTRSDQADPGYSSSTTLGKGQDNQVSRTNFSRPHENRPKQPRTHQP